jgi:hypothetical protein
MLNEKQLFGPCPQNIILRIHILLRKLLHHAYVFQPVSTFNTTFAKGEKVSIDKESSNTKMSPEKNGKDWLNSLNNSSYKYRFGNTWEKVSLGVLKFLRRKLLETCKQGTLWLETNLSTKSRAAGWVGLNETPEETTKKKKLHLLLL